MIFATRPRASFRIRFTDVASVVVGSRSVSFFELLVKITAVFVANVNDDIAYGHIRAFEKVAGDGKPLVHKQLLKAHAERRAYPAIKVPMYEDERSKIKGGSPLTFNAALIPATMPCAAASS